MTGSAHLSMTPFGDGRQLVHPRSPRGGCLVGAVRRARPGRRGWPLPTTATPELVAALEEQHGPPGRGHVPGDHGGQRGEVAGGEGQLGQRVGPVGVEAGRDQHPARRERLTTGAATSSRARRITSPVAPAGSGTLTVSPGGRRPTDLGGPPGARVAAATGGSRRTGRSGRPRTAPGSRCRGGRPSPRSAPARPRPPGRPAATATLLRRQKPMARSASAWWPGRPGGHEGEARASLDQASTATRPAPADSRAASHDAAVA